MLPVVGTVNRRGTSKEEKASKQGTAHSRTAQAPRIT